MKDKEIVKRLIKEREISQVELGAMCGYKGVASVATVLRGKKGMRVDTLVKLVGAMGCEVIVRDIESGVEYKVGETTPEQRALLRAKEKQAREEKEMLKRRVERIKELERNMERRAQEFDYSQINYE